MNRLLFNLAFVTGVFAVIWVGFGFIDSSALAMAMTALIFAVYLAGGVELHRFRQATAGLMMALGAIAEDLPDLNRFLSSLHGSLQHPVRLRIEGERAGLPGPALTPYLVGLLVMLGMLGTFLGMVVTLKGAVFTLEKSADLETMRSALAVPVKGLGLAFGTSVAGVAASAVLGLMSALCRRERMQAGQLLDAKAATVLSGFSHARQREQTFRALQVQSEAMPQVVDKLQSMMLQIEAMSGQLNQRLLANQEQFHSRASEAYTGLARSVDKSLRESLADSAQAAGESIKPIFEATMHGIAKETTAMHERTAATVQHQLDGLADRFGVATASVAQTWSAALDSQEQANRNLATDLGRSLGAFSTSFDQRAGAMVEKVGDALDSQEQANRSLTTDMGRSLEAFSASFDQRAAALVEKVGDAHANLQAGQAAHDEQRQQVWSQSLEAIAATLTRELRESGAQVLTQQREICTAVTHAVRELADQTQAGSDASLAETTRLITTAEDLIRSRIATEAQWLDQHRQRMDQLVGMLQTELGALRDQEAARGAAAVAHLGDLQAAVTTHLTTLGTALEEPIMRLIETAAEAPRAAAEVIGQMRQEISHSVARDNALLEERSRIMETLNALLDVINHASHEQRAVIDLLVASSSVKLDEASIAFSADIASESGKLSEIAASVTSSAVDVASLAAAFGVAVHSFNAANEKLASNLDRIEVALDKSMTRSDGQLAYYVAQAREIIDLSMSSQKVIIEELRQLPAMLADEGR